MITASTHPGEHLEPYRQPYEPAMFVGRETEMNQALRWVDSVSYTHLTLPTNREV